MLAFVMLWAYFSFSQYLIIYSAQPARGDHLVHRVACRPAGGSIGLALVVLHFAVPFLLLLSRARQARAAAAGEGRDRRARRAAHRPVLADRARVAPRRLRPSAGWTWLLPVALGGVWLGCFIWQLRGRAAAAAPRSAVPARRSGRSSTRRRSAPYAASRAITWSRSTSRRSHHEETRRQHPRDLRVRRRLLVVAVVVHVAVWGALQVFRCAGERRTQATDRRRSRPTRTRLPPEPRLQVDSAAGCCRTHGAQEDAMLNGYSLGRTARPASVRIPIDEAMRMTVRARPARSPKPAARAAAEMNARCSTARSSACPACRVSCGRRCLRR